MMKALNIGQFLREARIKANMTQDEAIEELSRQFNIDKTSNMISRYEKGQSMPSSDLFLALCVIYDVTDVIKDFVMGDDDESVDLTLEEKMLLEKYRMLNDDERELINFTLSKLVDMKQSNNVIIFPMFEANKNETPAKMRELDYYPMAAGMGTDRTVENPIPEKISYPESLIPPNTDYVISVSGDSMEPTFSSGDKLFIEATNQLEIGEIGVFNYMSDQLVKERGVGKLISHNPAYEPIIITNDCYIQGRVLGKLDREED